MRIDACTAPDDLAALPKVELHVHLEGTARPATQRELTAREGLPEPGPFRDLDGFVNAFFAVWQSLRQPGDYARLTEEFCEDAVRQGVRYAEVFITPLGRSYDALGEAVAAAARSDIEVRWVLDVPRQMPHAVGTLMLDLAEDVPEVVGLGLGGPESGFPPEPWAPLFESARERGLFVAPHAGEAAGPESVRGALDALGADRLAHGVRAVEDPALVERLATDGVHLAITPTSNVALGVVGRIEEHPLPALAEAGVPFSIDTDDPGFFGVDLLHEYAVAGELLGLDRAGYAALARASVEGSFAPEPLRAEILAAIDSWL